MPKQTSAQKIGSLGHSLVETIVRDSDFWIARNLTEDFGIDMEIEYAPDEVKGSFVKIQIKSHKEVVISGTDFISEHFSKSFLRYVYECRVPIILVVVSVDKRESWFIWLQKWLIDSENITNIYDESKTKSITVNLHLENDFSVGLQREIIEIATWENSTQLYIALRDLANLSLRMYDDELSKLLFGYLEKLKPTNSSDTNYLNNVIERVIELGASIWATHEGNKVSQMLFKYVRENGEKLNADHISKLILRGKECSRTGLNTLGILYDNYPAHTASLNLIERFKDFEDPRLHYYCTVRERYLGVKSPGWLNENNDLCVGKLKADFSDIGTSIFDKWANRGDSVIFDYVFLVT